jgi:hypothetical protein
MQLKHSFLHKHLSTLSALYEVVEDILCLDMIYKGISSAVFPTYTASFVEL